MTVLVCGGAGYIGSHTVRELLDWGYEVVVLDNLEKGHRKAVPSKVSLFVGDLRDKHDLEEVFSRCKIDAVIDFAAYSVVPESMSDPLKYYENNVYGTINLLKVMKKHGCRNIVFSSTAAAYGEPEKVPIEETDATVPTNAYGETKLSIEKMLKWVSRAEGINYGILRYFNAAGAHESGEIGEDHMPETHLIPLVLRAAAGLSDGIKIFGDDYPTFDGTCIRDYIHVMDLANAHVLTLKHISDNNVNVTYNLGNGKGFSVRQIIETAEKVTGRKIKTDTAARRPGDPATLVASSERIIRELGWKPKYFEPESIISSAWKWHSENPNGFEEQ